MLCIKKFCDDFYTFACHCLYLYYVWRIFVCVHYINAYVNEYTVACDEWNSDDACNTTRRRLFCFMCVN